MGSIHWDKDTIITAVVAVVILAIIFEGVESWIKAWRNAPFSEDE